MSVDEMEILVVATADAGISLLRDPLVPTLYPSPHASSFVFKNGPFDNPNRHRSERKRDEARVALPVRHGMKTADKMGG